MDESERQILLRKIDDLEIRCDVLMAERCKEAEEHETAKRKIVKLEQEQQFLLGQIEAYKYCAKGGKPND